jgi:integrase
LGRITSFPRPIGAHFARPDPPRPGAARRAHRGRDRRHDGLCGGREGAGDPAGYASDWRRDFAAWCASRGATALPAHVGIVAVYLSSLADSGRKSSTIGRRAAASGYLHKLAGHEPPTSQEGVRAVLRGIRRTIGAAKQGKAPATADLIGHMLALCPDNMIGKRDRALLAFGFAGAFRRSELCALEVADLTETPDGLRVLIRRSKGDQEGQGQEVAIPRGYRLRLVEAVQTWLAAAEISADPVFRAVGRGGRVSCEGLAQDSAARIVKRYAGAQGWPRCRLLRRPQPAQRVPHQRG